MPSNFKKLVRERQAKTGESYQTAARHIRAQVTLRDSAAEIASPLSDATVGGETVPPLAVVAAHSRTDASAVPQVRRALAGFAESPVGLLLGELQRGVNDFPASPEGHRLKDLLAGFAESPATDRARELLRGVNDFPASPAGQRVKELLAGLAESPAIEKVRELQQHVADYVAVPENRQALEGFALVAASFDKRHLPEGVVAAEQDQMQYWPSALM